MRTTLTLDDDLAGLLKQRAQELGVPFKEAVNRTIRAGLGDAASAGRRLRRRPRRIPSGSAQALISTGSDSSDSAVRLPARCWWHARPLFDRF
jgi:hypothetical protein